MIGLHPSLKVGNGFALNPAKLQLTAGYAECCFCPLRFFYAPDPSKKSIDAVGPKPRQKPEVGLAFLLHSLKRNARDSPS
jgi:hypothetical protein